VRITVQASGPDAVFALICVLIGFIAYVKGDFRAGFGILSCNFFVEAKERSKERFEKNKQTPK
jgi:hypothetical protein